MLTKRIIPCFDVDSGRVVKGTQFVELRDAGDPVELACRYDAEGADELVFLDITASSDNRATVYDMVARTASAKEYTAGHRLYGLVEGDLMWAFDMAAMGEALQPHLSARLARAVVDA